MKKIFTLISMALMAVGASAQSSWVAPESAPAAGMSIIKDDLMKVETVFETTCGKLLDASKQPAPETFAGKTFETYMQIRVDAAPTTDVPTGTEKAGSTPLTIEAKKNVDLTIYYRRQSVSVNDGESYTFNDNDGKDIKLIDQANAATAIAATTFNYYEIGTDHAYANAVKVYKLDAGKKYTLWARGTTGRLYGFDYAEGTGSSTGGDEQGDGDDTTPTGGTTLFSWAPDATTGGTVVASDGQSVGYKNGDYTTIRVNGKKADMNTNYIEVTLNEALQAGDVISITAYRNKDTDAQSSLYFLFENGTIVDDEFVFDNVALGQTPNTHNWTVAEAAGSKSFKLSRGIASTNVFITAINIVRGGTTAIQGIKAAAEDGVAYNLAGQKVDSSFKGIIIKNGKKMIQK